MEKLGEFPPHGGALVTKGSTWGSNRAPTRGVVTCLRSPWYSNIYYNFYGGVRQVSWHLFWERGGFLTQKTIPSLLFRFLGLCFWGLNIVKFIEFCTSFLVCSVSIHIIYIISYVFGFKLNHSQKNQFYILRLNFLFGNI